MLQVVVGQEEGIAILAHVPVRSSSLKTDQAMNQVLLREIDMLPTLYLYE